MTSTSSGLILFGGRIFDDHHECPIWALDDPFLDSEEVKVRRLSTFGPGPGNLQHVSLVTLKQNGLEYVYFVGGFKALVGAQTTLYRLELERNSWEKLASGPDARYKAAVTYYQGTVLVCGGVGPSQADYGDIWGYSVQLKKWTIWARNLPRCLNGFCFVKNEILYIVGEARKSNFVTINGFDLVERRLHSFYHKLPELVNFSTVMLGEREEKRQRVNSAPNLTTNGRSRSPKSLRNHVQPETHVIPAGHIEDEGISLNEVREQLTRISSVRYDAKNKKITFDGDLFRATTIPNAPKVLNGAGDQGSNSTSFARDSNYRSCRSDGSRYRSEEEDETTPVKHYSSYNGPQCLLVIGGKPAHPVFRREPLTLFRIDL